MRIRDWSSDVCSSDLRIATIPAHRPQDHITLEMAPLEIRHRSVRPISAKHAQASRFLQQSQLDRETAHRQVKYLNNVIEADHGKLKILIKPVRGFKSIPTETGRASRRERE